MKKFILALLLVAVLLSLLVTVALASVPEYEDPAPPGAKKASDNAAVKDLCVRVPSHAADNGHFLDCK